MFASVLPFASVRDFRCERARLFHSHISAAMSDLPDIGAHEEDGSDQEFDSQPQEQSGAPRAECPVPEAERGEDVSTGKVRAKRRLNFHV